MRSGPGAYNVVTIAEWENEAAVQGVRTAIGAFHTAIGLNPEEMMERLGVRADTGLYSVVEGRDNTE